MTANKALCNTIMIEPGWRFDDCAKTVLDAVVARPAHSSMWTSYTWLLLVRDPLERPGESYYILTELVGVRTVDRKHNARPKGGPLSVAPVRGEWAYAKARGYDLSLEDRRLLRLANAVRSGAAKFVEAPPSAPRRVAIEDLRRRLLHEEPEPRPRLGSEDRRPAAAAGPLRSATTLELRWLEEAGASSCDASARDAAAAAAAALARLGEGAAAGGGARPRLVKTVKNDFWVQFCNGLDRGDRTPCSLPPPRAVGMRLFGRVWAQSCGVVFDRSALKLGDDAAVLAAQHLLLAMAVRDLLGRGAESRLPILVLDASGSDEPAELTLAAQAGLLRRVAAADDDRSFAVHRSAPVLRDLGPFDLARSRSAPSTTAPPRRAAVSFATRDTSNGTRPPKADYAPRPLERQLHVA
ncbi:hypothetical protein JL722_14883 [Aureococcus anophagefferens]|nr:hypothetical protein JL722_14883 [Aureococcus anophagefferens]